MTNSNQTFSQGLLARRVFMELQKSSWKKIGVLYLVVIFMAVLLQVSFVTEIPILYTPAFVFYVIAFFTTSVAGFFIVTVNNYRLLFGKQARIYQTLPIKKSKLFSATFFSTLIHFFVLSIFSILNFFFFVFSLIRMSSHLQSQDFDIDMLLEQIYFNLPKVIDTLNKNMAGTESSGPWVIVGLVLVFTFAAFLVSVFTSLIYIIIGRNHLFGRLGVAGPFVVAILYGVFNYLISYFTILIPIAIKVTFIPSTWPKLSLVFQASVSSDQLFFNIATGNVDQVIQTEAEMRQLLDSMTVFGIGPWLVSILVWTVSFIWAYRTFVKHREITQ